MIGGLLKSTASRLALFAAAGVFVGGLAVPTANAADLGGDCCADLEERVAELEATTARKGNRKVSLTVSGQVNTAIMWWDDGNRHDVYGVDNSNSRSAFQFDGNAKVNPDLTAGFNLTVGISTGARSHQTSQADAAADGDDGGALADSNIAVETAFWYLDHKTLGKVSVGRINGASAGSTTIDLGGVGVIANAQIGLGPRAMFVTRDNGANPDTIRLTDLMGGSIVDISGLNRSNGIRYDTPAVVGFIASVAWGEDDMWDAALRYAGEFSGFRIAAAVAFSHNACGVNDCNDAAPYGVATAGGPNPAGRAADLNKWQGSASVLHVPTGLFVSGAYVQLSYDGSTTAERNSATGFGLTAGDQREDTKMWYVVGGVTKNWFGIGNTSVYGEYAKVADGASGRTIGGDSIFNSEVKMLGVGVVQNLDAAAMELYLGYRKYKSDFDSLAGAPFDTGNNINDISVVMGGARIKF